jgi:hypothetical protein
MTYAYTSYYSANTTTTASSSNYYSLPWAGAAASTGTYAPTGSMSGVYPSYRQDVGDRMTDVAERIRRRLRDNR